jgi:protein-tyrosine kinase
MTDTPDLVLRAAARLARAGGAQVPPDQSAPSRGSETGRVSAPASIRPVTPDLARSTDVAPKHSVNFSPAMLAANGIALPSAGFSRRVEEFRSIKRQVLTNALRSKDSPNGDLDRVVMVTSATPGDGKTYISINLALAIAFERDLNVILIDADAHRQSMLSYLGISAEKGWLDMLTDTSIEISDVMFGTNVPGLTIIPAGKTRPEIPELLSSRRMMDFITDLAKQNPNRLIILDTLPCLVSTEPTILASIVGQALFVVAANETSKEEIETSLRLIEACPNVSLILNKGDPLLIDQFSKYGYGYGYQNNA